MKRFIVMMIAGTSWLTAAAQQSQKSGTPFFVGVQAFESHYEVFFPDTPNDTRAGSWQVTAGINICPRLALQMGYTRTRESDGLNPSYTGISLTGQYLDGSSYSNRATDCLPILARYSVVRRPQPRLQIDGILGLCLLRTVEKSGGENRVNGQVVSSGYTENKAKELYITAGIGARYPFGRHLEGVFDWTYSKNIHQAPEYVHLSVTGNRYGLTRALSLGLRYRFAVKKKAAAAGS